MNLRDTNNFVKERGILLPNKQVQLTEAIFVYKKVESAKYEKDAIASLIIPIGAIVNLAQDAERKMRASQAYCYEIFNLDGKELNEANSMHDRNFKYHSGKKLGLKEDQTGLLTVDHENYLAVGYRSWHVVDKKIRGQMDLKNALTKCKVVPDDFNYSTSTCQPGIHFFVERKYAVNY